MIILENVLALRRYILSIQACVIMAVAVKWLTKKTWDVFNNR